MADPSTAQERARARVERRFGFYKHLATYVFVNAVLLVINLLTNPDSPGEPAHLWVKWPLLLWGIFLAWEGVKVLFLDSPRLNEAKNRALEREIQREKDAIPPAP